MPYAECGPDVLLENIDAICTSQTEDPVSFAASMLHLNEVFGTRVLGGCCGTEPTHMRHLAEQIRRREQGISGSQ